MVITKELNLDTQGNCDIRDITSQVEASAANLCNSGVYFHTEYQESGWPLKGFEVQINNTATGTPIVVSSYALGVDFALERDAAIAGRVIDYRENNGSFNSVDEITQVSGVGEATLAKFRDSVTVE